LISEVIAICCFGGKIWQKLCGAQKKGEHIILIRPFFTVILSDFVLLWIL